jgi:hypothetical protein
MGSVDRDSPIPRDGKVTGWKHPRGTIVVGDRATPDACPFCGKDVQPLEGGMLGQISMGEVVNPEPWQVVGRCPKCDASLHRIPGDPWTGTAS